MRFQTPFIVLLVVMSISSPADAQESCYRSLIREGISFDEKDIHWVERNPVFCREALSELQQDTSAMARASVQILIKLESNALLNLTPDQITENENLLADIIHGAFIDHRLEDQTAISATAWYEIFTRQMKE